MSSHLKKIREQRNETQADIARLLGVGASVVSKLEKGTYPMNVKKLKTLAEHFNVTTDCLLGLERVVTITRSVDGAVVASISGQDIILLDGYEVHASVD